MSQEELFSLSGTSVPNKGDCVSINNRRSFEWILSGYGDHLPSDRHQMREIALFYHLDLK